MCKRARKLILGAWLVLCAQLNSSRACLPAAAAAFAWTMRFKIDGVFPVQSGQCWLGVMCMLRLSCADLEVFFPYDFIYKEQLNFMVELKVRSQFPRPAANKLSHPDALPPPRSESAGCKG